MKEVQRDLVVLENSREIGRNLHHRRSPISSVPPPVLLYSLFKSGIDTLKNLENFDGSQVSRSHPAISSKPRNRHYVLRAPDRLGPARCVALKVPVFIDTTPPAIDPAVAEADFNGFHRL
jgi:hypothetical protein